MGLFSIVNSLKNIRSAVREDAAERDFSEGMKLLRASNLDGALRHFEKAYKADRNNPRYMSYYGVCVALRHGEIGLGLELCTSAIKKEFFRPEFYLNLAKVYLAAGNKKGAMNALKKGLRFDPDNREINMLLEDMGVRTRPFIPFLGRTNPVNMFLGNLFRRRLPELLRRRPPLHREGWSKGRIR